MATPDTNHTHTTLGAQPDKVTIAVVQFAGVQWEGELNAERAESHIKQAAALGAHVVTFPEHFLLTGVMPESWFLGIFTKLARRYAIDIVPGSILLWGGRDGWFNTSYYIDHTGTVLARYRKRNLVDEEAKYTKPGTEPAIFDTAYGKAALVICRDMGHTDAFEGMREVGVRIIYCPTSWLHIQGAMLGRELMRAFASLRANETGAAFVIANMGGTALCGEQETQMEGHSLIALPRTGVVQCLEHGEPAILLQELDLNHLEVPLTSSVISGAFIETGEHAIA